MVAIFAWEGGSLIEPSPSLACNSIPKPLLLRRVPAYVHSRSNIWKTAMRSDSSQILMLWLMHIWSSHVLIDCLVVYDRLFNDDEARKILSRCVSSPCYLYIVPRNGIPDDRLPASRRAYTAIDSTCVIFAINMAIKLLHHGRSCLRKPGRHRFESWSAHVRKEVCWNPTSLGSNLWEGTYEFIKMRTQLPFELRDYERYVLSFYK